MELMAEWQQRRRGINSFGLCFLLLAHFFLPSLSPFLSIKRSESGERVHIIHIAAAFGQSKHVRKKRVQLVVAKGHLVGGRAGGRGRK